MSPFDYTFVEKTVRSKYEMQRRWSTYNNSDEHLELAKICINWPHSIREKDEKKVFGVFKLLGKKYRGKKNHKMSKNEKV